LLENLYYFAREAGNLLRRGPPRGKIFARVISIPAKPGFTGPLLLFGETADKSRLNGSERMDNIPVERRSALRHPIVLSAELVDVKSGEKFTARTSDVSRAGCYLDTLNPIPLESGVRIRITHGNEVFEAMARVAYLSPGLGIGVAFTDVGIGALAMLDRWLSEANRAV
jgi:hypothetical protein